MKSKFLLLSALLLVCINLNAQNEELYHVYKNKDSIKQVDFIDYFHLLFKKKTNQENLKNKKINFSFFPTDTYSSGDRVLVTSFNATFLLGDKSNTNNSTVFFIPYISFRNQYGFELYPTIWLDGNDWNFVGEYFILKFPQDTWGLGGNTPNSNETLVDGNQIRVYQSVLKGIFPNFAVGLGYQYDRHYNLQKEDGVLIQDDSDFPEVASGESISSGIAFPAVYDSRKNIINPQKGFYGSFTYRYNSPDLGSDKQWQSVFLDIRKYFPIPNTRNTLTLRNYYWSVVSGKVPYFDLPATGSEPATGKTSRGIEKNRYRSNAMLYFESEYRFNISLNGFWGGVVFSNVTSASEYDTQNFNYWQPAAGFGVRAKFNKYTKVNLSLDVGFSKNYIGLYFNIGEAF